MSAWDNVLTWIAEKHEERGVEIAVSCEWPAGDEEDLIAGHPARFAYEIKATDMDGYYGAESYSASVYIGMGETLDEAAAKILEAIAFVATNGGDS